MFGGVRLSPTSPSPTFPPQTPTLAPTAAPCPSPAPPNPPRHSHPLCTPIVHVLLVEVCCSSTEAIDTAISFEKVDSAELWGPCRAGFPPGPASPGAGGARAPPSPPRARVSAPSFPLDRKPKNKGFEFGAHNPVRGAAVCGTSKASLFSGQFHLITGFAIISVLGSGRITLPALLPSGVTCPSPANKAIAGRRETRTGSSRRPGDFTRPAVYTISLGFSLGCYYY